MTYSELVASLAKAARLQKKQVDTVLWHLTRTVPEVVKDGRLLLPGLGTFRLRESKGRRIHNPVTKELQHLPASKTLGFKASAKAKARVSR